jgi:predicted lipoprotein with Yx(FWY)xxD motif
VASGVVKSMQSQLESKEITVRHRSAFATIALTCAALVVAGCGSSGTGSTGSGYPAASTTQSASAAAPAVSSGGASASASASGSGTSSSAASGTALTTVHTSLGTILAAGPKRLTVYLFAADSGSRSACSSECAQVWPPVTTTGAPQAQGGAQSAKLGTITRSDGTKQLTYAGHPLYYYVSDQSSGQTTGQGIDSFGAAWYVLNPQGAEVR